MEYKGYEIRFKIRWLVHGQTHDAACGVYKEGKLVAPCDTLQLAQRYIDQRVKMEERIGRTARDTEGSKSDSAKPERVRKARPSRKRV